MSKLFGKMDDERRYLVSTNKGGKGVDMEWNRFYCNNCDTDFETLDDSYSHNCPNCGRIIRKKKPKIHSEYAKTWCNGVLEFEGGNQYGCFWRCSKCTKSEVLKTAKQEKLRPTLSRDGKQ